MKTMIFKGSLIMLFIFMIPSILLAQNTLNVLKNDGSTVTFELSKLRKLTFPDRKVLITPMSGVNTEFSFSEIRNLNFSFVSSTSDLKNETRLQIYPNPVVNIVNVESAYVVSRFIVYDLHGNVIYQKFPESTSFSVETAHYPKGIYLLQIFTSEGILSSKIVKK